MGNDPLQQPGAHREVFHQVLDFYKVFLFVIHSSIIAPVDLACQKAGRDGLPHPDIASSAPCVPV
jgi:hypothetical protein